MAHDFPEIAAFESAFRFALEAEQACADLAAAAGVLAPTQEWQDKLEEIVCTHDDRVRKLSGMWWEPDQPVGSLNRNDYLGTLDAEPATNWPAVAEQLIRAEEDAARYHEDFAARCDEIQTGSAHLFAKSARQDRACAAELEELLG